MKLHLPVTGYYAKLKAELDAAQTPDEKFHTIVNAPFKNRTKSTSLGLGVIVLLFENPKTNTIDRIALSDTESAKGAVRMSAKPFNDIKVPLSEEQNIIVKALASGSPQKTDDWHYLFVPVLTAQQARFNQAGAGIGCSVVYPIEKAGGKGALIFSYYLPPEKIGYKQQSFMSKYSHLVSSQLAIET